MRSLRSLGNSYLAALVALVLPVAQSHAQECVKSEGLNVCAIGKAQVKQFDETSVLLTNLGAAGRDGASISLGQATDWTAAFETSSKPDQVTTFTAVSDGAAISTTTSTRKGEDTVISATFTGSGAESTYMVQAYRQGELVAELRNVLSGQVGAVARPVPGGNGPSCRPYYQSINDCTNNCYQMQYNNCNYCYVQCPRPIGFHNVHLEQAHLGACRWVIRDTIRPVVLADGNTVEADELVLTEEVRASGSYPYLSFERILFQATGGTARIGDQTVEVSK